MRLLLKLLMTAGILFFALRNIELAVLLRQFDRLDFFSVLLAFCLVSLSTLLAATRWHMVTLNTEERVPNLPFFIRSYYRGTFINQGLPTTLGGDTVRVVDLAIALGSKREAFGTVLLDRVIGLSSLLMINVLMIPLTFTLLPKPLALAIAGISIGGLLTFAVVLALPWHRISHHHTLLNFAAELSAFGRRVVSRPRNFFLLSLLSITVHASAILALFVLAQQFGVAIELWKHFVIQPSVFIAALLPISLAGWGVREGTMAAIFNTLGVPAAAIVATSLTYGVITLLTTLPGLFFLLRTERKSARLP